MPTGGNMGRMTRNESCAHLISDKSVTFYGCDGVTEYTSEKVTLRLSDLTATVTGSGLTLSAFYSAEIKVEGRICSVLLSGGDRK